jgi:hypothetical protein
MKAKFIDNFLTQEECDYIVETVNKGELWERIKPGDFWDNRTVNAMTLYHNNNKELAVKLFEVREKIREKIKELYSEADIFPDLCQVVRWFPGMEQQPHADDMTDSKDTEAFHHRHYGAILYLNDNYSGGKTYYPQHNFEITPVKGRLAIHPGDTEHYHGVTKVEGGIRYTMASFWTRNKDKYDNITPDSLKNQG